MGSTKLWVVSLAAAMLLAGTAYGAEEASTGAAAPDAGVIDAQDLPTSDAGIPAAGAPAGDTTDAASASQATLPADLSGAIAVSDLSGETADGTADPAAASLEMEAEESELGPAAPAADPLDAEDADAAALPGDASATPDMAMVMPEAETLGDAEAAERRMALGEIGYDDQGRRGRIHVVQHGDTLWDISEAYLGTPWVWPSIWDDNRNIENPHVIEPGDRIWITPTEMRRVTAEEAAALLANRPPEPAAAPDAFEAAPIPEPQVQEAAPAPVEVVEEARSFVVSDRESTGLITPEQLKASASIVGTRHERVMLSQEDEVYIGLGESQAQVGDQFTIFRTREQVFDPDTGALLGYHVEVLGWLEVLVTNPETSDARIAMSADDIEIGDRIMPRELLPARIAIGPSPEGVEGKISFFPKKRVLMGSYDYVYLNRGTDAGLSVGTPLEVYRSGYDARDEARRKQVAVPDRVVAELLVVRAATEASVALVTHTNTELWMGDRFRGSSN